MSRFSNTAIYANNSIIDINLVGEGFPGNDSIRITNGGALECHTDDTTCCRGIDSPDGQGRGEWYYPDGTAVLPPSNDSNQTTQLFYRTRGHMVIRLNQVDGNLTGISGVYRCEIPGADGNNITRYINLYNGSGSLNLLASCIITVFP